MHVYPLHNAAAPLGSVVKVVGVADCCVAGPGPGSVELWSCGAVELWSCGAVLFYIGGGMPAPAWPRIVPATPPPATTPFRLDSLSRSLLNHFPNTTSEQPAA